jgi:hypothetical protein
MTPITKILSDWMNIDIPSIILSLCYCSLYYEII